MTGQACRVDKSTARTTKAVIDFMGRSRMGRSGKCQWGHQQTVVRRQEKGEMVADGSETGALRRP